MPPSPSKSDFKAMKLAKVAAQPIAYSFGEKADIEAQFAMLEREFAGQPQLVFFHAKTIVRIRREKGSPRNTALFWDMWTQETAFLLEHLDTRWLVSACDTIVDVIDDVGEQKAAMFASFLANTVKLYETERAISGPAPKYDMAKLDRRVPLFDGTSAFLVGRGDMIRNLMQRLDQTTAANTVSDQILRELIRRFHHHDTVFARFAACHTNERTKYEV